MCSCIVLLYSVDSKINDCTRSLRYLYNIYYIIILDNCIQLGSYDVYRAIHRACSSSFRLQAANTRNDFWNF